MWTVGKVDYQGGKLSECICTVVLWNKVIKAQDKNHKFFFVMIEFSVIRSHISVQNPTLSTKYLAVGVIYYVHV